jgi:hypothetical protein
MKTGDTMSLTLMSDGVVIMQVKKKRISDLAGLLHKKMGGNPYPLNCYRGNAWRRRQRPRPLLGPRRVLAGPDLRDWITKHGGEPMNMTQFEFARFVPVQSPPS